MSELLHDQNVKVACITETHLISSVTNSFIDIPHFSLVRNDVSGQVPKHGVCVYVHNSVLIDSIDAPISNVLTFRLVSLNVYVVVVYRPPSNTPHANNQVASFLNEFCLNKEVVVAGDFNLPHVNWESGSANTSGHLPPLENMFIDVFDTLGLTQWVSEPTFPRSGNTLDLILTSEEDRAGSVLVLPPLAGCDHCPILFDFVFQTDICTPQGGPAHAVDQHRVWHRGKYSAIQQHLSDIDWELELAHLNVNDCVTHFGGILSDLVSQFVPVKRSPDLKPPWQTRPPTSLIHERQQIWQKYKAVRQHLGRASASARAAFTEFNLVNKRYRSFAVRSRADYESNLIAKSKENPKALHSYIRNQKTGCPTVGPLRLVSGELSDDPTVLCECFAECFSAVYNRIPPVNAAPHQQHDGNMSDIVITPDEVRAVLDNLNGSSAMGPDEAHPLLLKSCSSELARPLSIIFNRSLREGVVPATWKFSTVVPIFKKGTRYDPSNYRPVSLTSVMCKSLERIIAKHLTEYLEDGLLLDQNQFGFRAGRSTSDQLLLVYSEVSKKTR